MNVNDFDFAERLNTYNKDYCWQYDIRLNNLQEDLKLLPIDFDYKSLKVNDFTFKILDSDIEKQAARQFIERHEWLGKIALNTTHYFGAYYNDILAGVITMGCPAMFSKLLGEDTKNIERLISRGACISWSPKCLASAFMMWCIKYMVHNTQYRIFTAYSDPMAKELGTIYQSCNFYYLGSNFGGSVKYISPYSGKVVSDRCFRARSYYKQYAKELNIEWQKEWSTGDKVNWDNIPADISTKLRDFSKRKQQESEKIIIKSKHKYAYVLGNSKIETNRLRKKFLCNNRVYEYPKER